MVERSPSEKFKNLILNMNIESKIKFNNADEVEHKLKSNQDGSFEVSAVPTRAGNYFVSFYKDGFKIEGLIC